jgi:hypothetical protein
LQGTPRRTAGGTRMKWRVLVTPLSDRVLPALFWSGPFTRKSDAVANVLFWRSLGGCSARVEMIT